MRLWCLWPLEQSFEEPIEPYKPGDCVHPLLVTVLSADYDVEYEDGTHVRQVLVYGRGLTKLVHPSRFNHGGHL